jgi:hypothetical protein
VEIGHTLLAQEHPNLRAGGNLGTTANAADHDGKFPQGPWLARGERYQPANPILQLSRHRMPLRGGRMLRYVPHDPRFLRLVIGHTNLEKVAGGCRWAKAQRILPRALPHRVEHSEQSDDAL